MATFPQKTSVATAVTHRSEIQLKDRHMTTTNFMEVGVAKIIEMVPTEGINLDMRSFARLDTMKKPTQGDVNVNSRVYFVPFRVIQKGFQEMENGVPRINSSGEVVDRTEVDYITNLQFMRSFVGNGETFPNEYIAEVTRDVIPTDDDISAGDNYDFTIPRDIAGSGNNPARIGYDGYRFTAKGARIFKLLCQLGYAIDFNALNLYQRELSPKSALPLKALVKIFSDHYYPSQYAMSDEFYFIKSFLEYDGIDDFSTYCDYNVLRRVYDFIDKVCYDNDYFVSAWDNPNSPNVVTDNITIRDINGYPNSSTSGRVSEVSSAALSSGSPAIRAQDTGSFSNITTVSQYMVTALKSLTDYMKRHQIAGARVIDRYLSRWGVVLPDAKLDRSVYIDNFVQPVLFGDVTSTADTEGANLGSYAGKGIIPERDANFSFNTDERGYFIILSSCVPVVGYYQGEDRMISHINMMDFYTPEFDNLGVQGIATKELYMPLNTARQFGEPTNGDNIEGQRLDTALFGFAPRFAEYKVGRDKLTGDFRLGSRNTELDAWHLFRDMNPFFEGKNFRDVKHDINFIRGLDSAQYNRIFNYMGDLNDKIKIVHYFNYTLSFPGRKLYDTYEFTDEDKAQHVSVDVGGSKAN